MELVKSMCGSGLGGYNFLQKAGLVKLSLEMVEISQTFCRSGWDWSRVSTGAGRIGQTFCRSQWVVREECLWDWWHWSYFMQEWVGLVKLSEGTERTS